jgi:Flp pilus assembly protein TadG
MIHRLSALRRRWQADDTGIAAVEFALLAPVMATVLLGLLQIGLVAEAQRRAEMAAYVLGDALSRTSQISQSTIDNLALAVQGTLDRPAGGTADGAAAMIVQFDASSRAAAASRVIPIYGSGAADDLQSVAMRSAAPNDVVVAARVVVRVSSIVGSFLPPVTVQGTVVTAIRSGFMPTVTATSTGLTT